MNYPPKMASCIVNKPIDSILPYAKNARTHTDTQIAAIAASIKEFGFNNPLLTDSEGGLIAGHGRLLAAQKLGLEEVPVVELDHLTESQRRAYILADNRIAELARWDPEMLTLELSDLEAEFDWRSLGFDDSFFTASCTGKTPPPDVEVTDSDEKAPEVKTAIVTVPGDVWLLGPHRIMCGDSTVATDVSKLLAGQKPHLMVTDPPYGIEYDAEYRNKNLKKRTKTKRTDLVLNDDNPDWTEAWALFPGIVGYVWHSAHHASTVHKSLIDCGYVIHSQIVWVKNHFNIGRSHYQWQHECCYYFSKKWIRHMHWQGGRNKSTVWNIKLLDSPGVDDKTTHATQKPLLCMLNPILNSSVQGDTVYEPFLGSGTTLIACEKAQRICMAMELSPAYVDMAVRRWIKITGKKAVLEENNTEFPAG